MADSFEYRKQIEYQRENDIQDNGTTLIPSITLYDVDYAILWQLSEGFKFFVEERTANGEVTSIPVPVIIASPEKWVQIRKFGYLRGPDNKLLKPYIIINRTSVVEDDMFQMLDIPDTLKQYYVSPKQTADRFNNIRQTDNTKESVEYIVSTLPEPVIITYDIIIYTSLQTQLNSIVEQIIPNNKIPWGDTLQFITKIGPWSFEAINEAGSDRALKASATMEVRASLQNEYTVLHKEIQTAYSVKRIHFTNEYEEDSIYVDQEPKIIKAVRPTIKT